MGYVSVCLCVPSKTMIKLLCLGLLVAFVAASNDYTPEAQKLKEELESEIEALKNRQESDKKQVLEEIKKNRNWEFKFDDRKLNWTAAEKTCVAWGGHLLTVKSSHEQNYFAKEVKAGKWGTSWIGYTDDKNEGEWKWVGDEMSTYENWRRDTLTHEPNGGRRQNCARIVFGNGWQGRWDDWWCAFESNFICE